MKSVLIGIAGGTGSGKSTFTNRLKDVTMISLCFIMTITIKNRMAFPSTNEKR